MRKQTHKSSLSKSRTHRETKARLPPFWDLGSQLDSGSTAAFVGGDRVVEKRAGSGDQPQLYATVLLGS